MRGGEEWIEQLEESYRIRNTGEKLTTRSLRQASPARRHQGTAWQPLQRLCLRIPSPCTVQPALACSCSEAFPGKYVVLQTEGLQGQGRQGRVLQGRALQAQTRALRARPISKGRAASLELAAHAERVRWAERV